MARGIWAAARAEKTAEEISAKINENNVKPWNGERRVGMGGPSSQGELGADWILSRGN